MTQKVLGAAKDAGVSFVVVTSSSASVSVAVQPADPAKGFSSGDWSDVEKLQGWKAWYPLSKTLAEKAAWSAAAEFGLPLATICPCQIFGPKLQPGMNTSSGKIFDLLNGKPAKAPNSRVAGAIARAGSRRAAAAKPAAWGPPGAAAAPAAAAGAPCGGFAAAGTAGAGLPAGVLPHITPRAFCLGVWFSRAKFANGWMAVRSSPG